jgi:hypothetical protein
MVSSHPKLKKFLAVKCKNKNLDDILSASGKLVQKGVRNGEFQI